jgi:para-nitrobenzyl esterase
MGIQAYISSGAGVRRMSSLIRGLRVAVIAMVLGGTAGAAAQTLDSAPIATTSGTFKGVPAGAGVSVFKGIRYAAAPEGALRWKPPQAPKPVAGVVTADTFGSQCPQTGAATQSEDCLFLNIYVPSSAKPGANLPTLVFLHGGAFLSGSGAPYDGSAMSGRYGS